MKRYVLNAALGVLGLLIVTGCEAEPRATEPAANQQEAESASPQGEQQEPDPVTPAESAEQASEQREQQVGQPVPDVIVRTVNGERASLRQVAQGQPSVLIFYRGGWCPYCSAHLAELQGIHDQLRQMGYQVLAVSPDRPEELRKSAADQELDYALISDSDMRAADALGLAFRVDEPTVTRYLDEHQIDLEASSGREHNMLPVPAVFLADADGRIVFEHVDPNYRQRLSGDRILAAARDATRQ